MIINVGKAITSVNDGIAAELCEELRQRQILCLNLISAPGSGKTALIEQTIRMLAGRLQVAVIEGDPHTDLDSARVRAAGSSAVQINTLAGCHLDAMMIKKSLTELDLTGVGVLLIENVGNLLCPGPWALGEHSRVVMTSLPEGADKPLKYPETFAEAEVLLINKIDLAAFLKTTAADIAGNAHLINPNLTIFPVSCETGEGLSIWCDWLLERRRQLCSHA
jgi:hydrogenase nickel incorporation protein HypB